MIRRDPGNHEGECRRELRRMLDLGPDPYPYEGLELQGGQLSDCLGFFLVYYRVTDLWGK